MGRLGLGGRGRRWGERKLGGDRSSSMGVHVWDSCLLRYLPSAARLEVADVVIPWCFAIELTPILS